MIIECQINGHKSIFTDHILYAKHLLKHHRKNPDVKILIKWAKQVTLRGKGNE